MRHFFESELAPERLEVGVIRVRQRQRQIHVAAAAKTNFSFLGDDFFAQRRQRDRQLDRRTGLRAAGKRHLLVDHGQDAATGRLDREHGAVHVAESINRSLSHDRVFARSHVAVGNILCVGTGGKAFVVMMAFAGSHRAAVHAATACQMSHVMARVLIFSNCP